MFDQPEMTVLDLNEDTLPFDDGTEQYHPHLDSRTYDVDWESIDARIDSEGVKEDNVLVMTAEDHNHLAQGANHRLRSTARVHGKQITCYKSLDRPVREHDKSFDEAREEAGLSVSPTRKVEIVK